MTWTFGHPHDYFIAGVIVGMLFSMWVAMVVALIVESRRPWRDTDEQPSPKEGPIHE